MKEIIINSQEEFDKITRVEKDECVTFENNKIENSRRKSRRLFYSVKNCCKMIKWNSVSGSWKLEWNVE